MKLEVKLKRDYKSKTESLVLVNYDRDIQRMVNITYPKDWDCEKLNFHIQQSHDAHVRRPYASDYSSLVMKDNLQKIKRLGYRVIAINRLYGYIVRRDGKFLRYGLAKHTTAGGVYFTYAYVPSRSHGNGAIQGGEEAYNFGNTDFSTEQIDKMMDSPKLYGKVEHYKNFKEFCKREYRYFSALGKFI